MTTFDSSFTVFPEHTNYNEPPCIFGGKMLAEMDNAAAMASRRALYGTGCTDAVTVKVDVEFSRPAYVGDIILLRAEVVAVGHKSLDITVDATREDKKTGELSIMAKGRFRFVARREGVPSPHGLQAVGTRQG